MNTPASPGPGAKQKVAAGSLAKAAGTQLTFWGVRGSIPTPGPATVIYGGNTSCIEVRAEGEIVIMDGGTGLRLLGKSLLTEFGEQPLDLTLLLTHTHWDHIQGLPFFPPMYKPRNRLRILGYEGARLGLDHVLSGQMENPFFPIGLSEVPANVQIEELKDMSFKLGAIRVEARIANHPGICVGYRLFTQAGSIAFFPDNEPHRGSNRSGAAVATGHPDQKLIDFLRGVDVLVMDAQYDQAEYAQHTGWGHGCVDDVVELAAAAGAKRLFLFHHDPEHDDARIDQMVAYARELAGTGNGAPQIEAAREGLTVQLGGQG